MITKVMRSINGTKTLSTLVIFFLNFGGHVRKIYYLLTPLNLIPFSTPDWSIMLKANLKTFLILYFVTIVGKTQNKDYKHLATMLW